MFGISERLLCAVRGTGSTCFWAKINVTVVILCVLSIYDIILKYSEKNLYLDRLYCR